jgi:hypothetical protein
MEEKKYKLTFYMDNQKEDHPDLPWDNQFVFVQERSTPPALPVGRSRKDKQRNSLVKRKQHFYPAVKHKVRAEGKKGSKLVLVACSAVAVGLIIGLSVLSLFAQDEGQDLAESHTGQTSPIQNGAQDTLLMPAGYVENGRLYLPSRSYFVVQAGAFSEKESALKAQDQLQEKGYPAAIFRSEDVYRVYMAIGLSREDGRQLGQMLENERLDLYLRSYQTSEVELNVGQVEEKLGPLPQFLARSDQLLNQLLERSTEALVSEERVFSDDDMRAAHEMHRQLLLEGQQVLNQVNGPMAQLIEQLMRELTLGVSALDAFENQPHLSYMWKIQEVGLNYLTVYEELLSQLKDGV